MVGINFKFYDNLISDIVNWREYFVHKSGLPTSRGALYLTTKNGVTFEVPREQMREFEDVFVHRVYTRDFPQPIEMDPNGYIIDAGANYGLFTVFLTQHFPYSRIITLEPKPDSFSYLRKLIDRAPEYPITARQTTLAKETGWITIPKNPYAPKNSQTIKASCISLPELLDVQNVKSCELLKMKCEGRDYPIIYEMTPAMYDCIKRFVLEVYPGPEANDTIEGLSFFLLKKGYESRICGTILSAWRS